MNSFSTACLGFAMVCLVLVWGPLAWAQEAAKKAEPIMPDHAELHTLQSKIVERKIEFFVFLPPSYDLDRKRPFPIVYHLHHNGGTHFSFFSWLGFKERKNAKTGEVIPRISGGKWLYEMMKAGEIIEAVYVVPKSPYNAWDEKMGRVIVEEVIPYVNSKWNVSKNRQQRMVQGISMGGAGSLLYVGRYANIFGAAQSIIGYAPPKSKWKELANGYRRVRIRMDQGAHDEFDGALNNTEFALFLARQKIAFQLELYSNYGHHASRILRSGGDRIFAFQREFFTARREPEIRRRSYVDRLIENNQVEADTGADQ